MSSRNILVAALVAVAFLVGAIVGGQVGAVRDNVDEIFGAEDAQSEAIEVIEDNYFEEIDPDELERDSVRALVGELKRRYKDRFTHYFGPSAFERFKQVTEGKFSGVGLTVTEVPRGLRVATVFDASPAKEAGIEEGDLVTAVDGQSIAGQSSELSTAEIKGRPGTPVELTVLSGRTRMERQLTLTRRQLDVPVVEGELKQVDGHTLGYLELLGFSQGAHAELKRQAEALYEQGAEGLVVDLRGNGGGLLTEAVLTSSVFVEDGVIVSTEGRTQSEEVFEAVGEALPEKPLVVLIDRDSASASEIFTAALSEAGVATVVGQKSFGKGTFQEVIPLNGGEDGALDLTVGEYKTRDGTSINGVGIEPEIQARDRQATKPDEGLDQALQVLASQLSGE